MSNKPHLGKKNYKKQTEKERSLIYNKQTALMNDIVQLRIAVAPSAQSMQKPVLLLDKHLVIQHWPVGEKEPLVGVQQTAKFGRNVLLDVARDYKVVVGIGFPAVW